MKTPHSTLYRYSAEAVTAANRIPTGTIAEHAHKIGMTFGEPLTIMLDSLLKYAESYRIRHESPLSEDYVLGPAWLRSIAATRELLNGDGADAMRKNITSDSKCNGALESLFWDAINHAGFTEADVEAI
jgi:hypothetical protein